MILRKAVRLLVLVPLVSLACAQTASPPLFFRVTLDSGQQPASGRLLIFLTSGSGAKSVEVNQFKPSAVSIAAKEISGVKPGESASPLSGASNRVFCRTALCRWP